MQMADFDLKKLHVEIKVSGLCESSRMHTEKDISLLCMYILYWSIPVLFQKFETKVWVFSLKKNLYIVHKTFSCR